MGTALLQGILGRRLLDPARITVFDPHPPAVEAALAALPGIQAAPDATTAVEASEAVLLCVKPAGILPLISSLQGIKESRLLISIAAGVTLKAMEAAAGHHRVVRVMPNTPALIGQGACGLCGGPQRHGGGCFGRGKFAGGRGLRDPCRRIAAGCRDGAERQWARVCLHFHRSFGGWRARRGAQQGTGPAIGRANGRRGGRARAANRPASGGAAGSGHQPGGHHHCRAGCSGERGPSAPPVSKRSVPPPGAPGNWPDRNQAEPQSGKAKDRIPLLGTQG